jgi:UMF1 family MFS transporter
MEKNNPKITNAWCMYDWANSVFSLIITSAIFPIYFEATTGGANATIQIWGMTFVNSALHSYILAVAFLLVALINPLLSGISDSLGLKKIWMVFFTLVGSIGCISLYAFTSSTIWIGIVGFAVATIGYAGSLVFYNSYLPEIASSNNFDKLSARGFSFGYVGAVILLVINLIFITFYSDFGFASKGYATRFSFLTVGVWWIGFALIPFYYLPKDIRKKNVQGLLSKGYKEIKTVFDSIQKVPIQKRFLASFFFYSMGTQTVMYVAALFGTAELKLEANNLIIVILLIQLLAIVGASFFAKISQTKGTFLSLSIMIGLWIIVCIGAYYTTTANEFYILAALVGTVMGGIQSQSRSAYAFIIPGNKDNASYFSFYEFTEKIAIVIGTFSYGYFIELTGGMRNSILLLACYFVIGLLLMLRLMRYNYKTI